jgi:hypothetical protein
MLRFCIDLVQSLYDRGPRPTAFHDSRRGLAAGFRRSGSGSNAPAHPLRQGGDPTSEARQQSGRPDQCVHLPSCPGAAALGRGPRPTQRSITGDPGRHRCGCRRGPARAHHRRRRQPSMIAPATVANLLWSSSTRIVFPPGSNERDNAGQTARRQVRCIDNRGLGRERQPFSSQAQPNTCNLQQHSGAIAITPLPGDRRAHLDHARRRPVELQAVPGQSGITTM